MEEGGTIPILIKNYLHLHFIFHLPLSSQIFSKSKLKHIVVDITCFLQEIKVHWCRFENLSICFYWYKNNILKVLHSEFSSYSPAKFVFFLKSRLLFSVFYYFFCMFVNKHSGSLTCFKVLRIFKGYLRKWKML